MSGFDEAQGATAWAQAGSAGHPHDVCGYPAMDLRMALQGALTAEARCAGRYAAAIRRFGPVAPFAWLALAEQRHVHAIDDLLRAHGFAASDANGGTDAKALSIDDPGCAAVACGAAAAAESDVVNLYDSVLLPAVLDAPDVAAVFRRLRDSALHCRIPTLRHWAHLHRASMPGAEILSPGLNPTLSPSLGQAEAAKG